MDGLVYGNVDVSPLLPSLPHQTETCTEFLLMFKIKFKELLSSIFSIGFPPPASPQEVLCKKSVRGP